MITEYFLSLPYYLLKSIINIIPVGGGVPNEYINALHTMWGYLQTLAFIIPVETILWCIGIMFAFELGVLLFQGFVWILAHI